VRPFPEILAKKTQLEREYLEALEGFTFGEEWEFELLRRKAKLQACCDLLAALFAKPELKDE
jgi:hypothetical protein